MLKKYTIEELKNLNQEELLHIEKVMAEGKFEFEQYTQEENRLILEKLKQRYEHFIEKACKELAKIFNHKIFPEQFEALKEAFDAYTLKDWVRCRSALEVFFEYEKPEDICQLDPSDWDYHNILRWFEMLYETNLSDDPDGSPARIFSEMINDAFILKMPPEFKPKLKEGLKKFFPELNDLLENSTTYSEDGLKCIKISEVAENLGVSEEEIIQVLDEAETGEFILTEDKIHKLQ